MPSIEERRRRHRTLAAGLDALNDAEFAALVASDAQTWRRGWGETAVVELGGEKTFVKKISLSALEQAPGNADSTANIFGLPLFYQYGVGSGGFGAWRELRAQVQASDWALAGGCAFFPLVYHWRVVGRTPPPLPPAFKERIDGMVPYWNGSDAVARRLNAMFNAPAQIVVFLEYAPETLHQWGARVTEEGQAASPAAGATAVRLIHQLREATAFMNVRGMLHFDLHGHNLLTDGEQLFVCDFGLALSSAFDLSSEERAFLETHRHYDRAYIEWAMIAWLADRQDSPIDWRADPQTWPAMPPAIAPITDRYRPAAGVIGAFLATLRVDKTIPYPAADIDAALAAADA